MQREQVTVRVPATTANLGPGYDVFGMAVDLWCEVTVTRVHPAHVADAPPVVITMEGPGADLIPKDTSNYVYVGLEKIFKLAGSPLPPVTISIRSQIPYGAGLGSSSAGIVAGLLAGCVLADVCLPVEGKETLVQLATEVEGHPDNIAPAIYGGLQIGGHDGERWFTERVPVPSDMQCVFLLTNFQNNTKEARRVVPTMVPIGDVVHNLSQTALITLAFCTNQLHLLRKCTQDRLHQTQRAANLPHLLPAIEAALAAGAYGSFLSGSGPTVGAITAGFKADPVCQCPSERIESKVALAMIEAAERAQISPVRVILTTPVQYGAHVVSCVPPIGSQQIGRVSPYSTTNL